MLQKEILAKIKCVISKKSGLTNLKIFEEAGVANVNRNDADY